MPLLIAIRFGATSPTPCPKNSSAKCSIFRDLPPRLPALLFAVDVYKRAEKAGLAAKASWNESEDNTSEDEPDEDKMGRALFLLVSACQKTGVDPEAALRRYASEMVEELEPQSSLEKD